MICRLHIAFMGNSLHIVVTSFYVRALSFAVWFSAAVCLSLEWGRWCLVNYGMSKGNLPTKKGTRIMCSEEG